MDRLLFASGWPAQTPAEAIERLYSLNSFSQGSNLPTIPRTTLHSIIERDSLEALGIERGALSGVVPPRQNVLGTPSADDGFATEASQQSLNN